MVVLIAPKLLNGKTKSAFIIEDFKFGIPQCFFCIGYQFLF